VGALLQIAAAAGAVVVAPNAYGSVLAGLQVLTVIALAAVVISDDLTLHRLAMAASVLATFAGTAAVQVHDPSAEAVQVAGLPQNRWKDATGLAVQGPTGTALFSLDDPKLAGVARPKLLELGGVQAGILLDGRVAGFIAVRHPPPGAAIGDEVANLDGPYVRSDDLVPSGMRAAAWTSSAGASWAIAVDLGDARDLLIRLDGDAATAARDRHLFDRLVEGITFPPKPKGG
jgi:hypothetical protein